MSDALEQELRAALAERARRLPPADTDDWLARIGAQHRRRFGRLRSPLVPSAAAAVAAIILAVVLLSGGHSLRRSPAPLVRPHIPAAYVGWTPVPSKATTKRIADYAKRCRWAASNKSRLGPPLIADVRGPYTAILFVDERDNYERFCIYGPRLGLQGADYLRSPPPFQAPGPDGIQHNRMGGSCDPTDGRAVTEMHGQIGADVTGATFKFRNRPSVQATVKDGSYLVWWPWGESPRSITLTTTTGTTYIELPSRLRARWC